MEAIMALDRWLFFLINGSSTYHLDFVMPFVTQKFNFLGAIIAGAVFIMVFGKRRDRWGLVLLVIVVLSSDLASNLLKGVFARTRPCNAMEGVRMLSGCGSSYSFPSGHATNIFAAMAFLTTRYRRYFPVFFAVALVVGYSRVYVGVHYPADVLAGALLGSALAVLYAGADKRYFTPRIDAYFMEKAE